MSVIDSYLETLFSPYPDSPRMHEAKVELRSMMEDQYQGLREEGLTESQALGRVIAEFGSLEEVSSVLGIEREVHGGSPSAAEAEPVERLTLERAEQYTEAVRGSQKFSAAAIPLFVLCPVPLLLLIALSGTSAEEPANWVVAVGLVSLLVLVTAGVLILTLRSSHLADFEDIEENETRTTAQVRTYAQDLRREHRSAYTGAMAIAIALWILCAVPTLLVALAAGEGSLTPLYGVSGTLVMVALGLFISIRAGWSDHVASTLLQEDEDEDMPETSDSPVIRVIAAVYWPLAAAIYLAWSFATDDWGFTWIIWPVAGVLYAALWSVNAALSGSRADDTRRSARA